MADAVERTRYFTVVDEAGRAEPVVEFWAGSVDYDQLVYQGSPLRRFLKVLGTGEYLSEESEGVFVETGSGRRLFQVNAAA